MIGYKAFKSDLKNKYDRQFELNKKYINNEELIYGENGHGFHFAENLEDTMRFFNPATDTIFCLIETSDEIALSFNENYYNSGNMYVSKDMIIKKILTREDILNYTLELDEKRMIRMLSLYPFNRSELQKLKEHLAKNNMKDALVVLLKNQTGVLETFKRDKRYLRSQEVVKSITRK